MSACRFYSLGVFGPSSIFLFVRVLFLPVGRCALQGLTRLGVFNKQVDRGLAEGSLFLQAPVISDGRYVALYVLAAAPCASATFITAPSAYRAFAECVTSPIRSSAALAAGVLHSPTPASSALAIYTSKYGLSWRRFQHG